MNSFRNIVDTGEWKVAERSYETKYVEQTRGRDNQFTVPVPEHRLELAVVALRAHGFTVKS